MDLSEAVTAVTEAGFEDAYANLTRLVEKAGVSEEEYNAGRAFPATEKVLREFAASVWGEAVQAVSWAMEHGSWPDAGTYTRDHNPYEVP